MMLWKPAAPRLAALWLSDQRGEKHIAAAASLEELHNKIIITSAQPSLFSFHLSLHQHGLFVTLGGLALFITGCQVESGVQACCVEPTASLLA